MSGQDEVPFIHHGKMLPSSPPCNLHSETCLLGLETANELCCPIFHECCNEDYSSLRALFHLCKTSEASEVNVAMWVFQKKKLRTGEGKFLPKDYVIAIFPAQDNRVRSQTLYAAL